MNITDYFPDYIEVGYLKKTTGINGKLRYFVEPEFAESITSAAHCFFLLKGCMVPYFLVNKGGERADGILKFDSVKNPEDAKVIVSRTIYLHKDQIVASTLGKSKLTFEFIRGLEIFNVASKESIGVVTSIESYPEQEIAIVIGKDDKEFMLPVNEFNFKGLDEEERHAYFEIPDGLLDL